MWQQDFESMGKEELVEDYKVITGDALEILPTLPTVDAVITDPPYVMGAKAQSGILSDLRGRLNPWQDRMNHAVWYAAWFEKAKRLIKPTGCLWVFGNWKSIPTYTKALCDCGLEANSMLVWDKGSIGPAHKKALRTQHEIALLIGFDDFVFTDRSAADVQRFDWSTTKPSGHPAEKPQSLMRWIIERSVPRGGVVLDPFAGSGTTGAAALECGRRFIGIEQDAYWSQYAADRCRNVHEIVTSTGGELEGEK